jgi:hypothetical protein
MQQVSSTWKLVFKLLRRSDKYENIFFLQKSKFSRSVKSKIGSSSWNYLSTPVSSHLPPAPTQGQEVEFHEIKIQLFQEVKFSIMRLKFLKMIRSPDQPFYNEIEIQKKALLGNFDLMIDLLAARTIMRSKFKKHY